MSRQGSYSQAQIDSFVSKYVAWTTSLPESDRALATAIVDPGLRFPDESDVTGYAADPAAHQAQADAVKKVMEAVNAMIAAANKQAAVVQQQIRS